MLCLLIASCKPEWSSAGIKESQGIGDEIVTALKEYKTAMGQYPKSLESLVPGYFAEVPKPTVGTRKWEYRVGPDGQYYLAVRRYENELLPLVYYTPADGQWTHDDS